MDHNEHPVKLIVATHNADKLREIREILSEAPVEILSQSDIGFHEDVVEDGDSFAANALIKARAVHASQPDAYCIADDSGLCVDALGGAPGIYSARFADTETDYPRKFAKLWEMLQDVDPADWTARYVCAMAVVRPDGSAFVTLGTMEGRLVDEPAGEHGFGYDPIFVYTEAGQTVAEMDPVLKNQCSHRAVAIRKMAAKLMEDWEEV